MTNGWTDIKNTDVILAMGGNPAENHPCGFKWVIEAKKTRRAKLVSVDPRFTRTAAVADLYCPLRAGTDIAFLRGLIRYAIENKRFHEDYVKLHTNALFLLEPGFELAPTASSPASTRRRRSTTRRSGPTTLDEKGFAKRAASLEDPRCVFQLLKKHVARYTPEMVAASAAARRRTSSRSRSIVTSTGNAGPRRHDHLRARLDPALDRRADHPRGGDPPAPARQRRPARRRRERAPRPLQHPGRHRHGGAFHVLAGYLAMPTPRGHDARAVPRRASRPRRWATS